MIVTIKHFRQCKYCSYGARAFFIRHGFDWSEFLKHGISSDELESTGDALAIKAVKVASGKQ